MQPLHTHTQPIVIWQELPLLDEDFDEDPAPLDMLGEHGAGEPQEDDFNHYIGAMYE